MSNSHSNSNSDTDATTSPEPAADAENKNGNENKRIMYDQRSDAIEVGRSVAALTAIKNGQNPPDIDDETAATLGVTFHSARRQGSPTPHDTSAVGANHSPNANAPQGTLSDGDYSRTRGRSGPGTSHGGTRDYWEVFGYPGAGEVTPEEYEKWAQRDAIASTIAYRPVNETWKNEPRVHDDGLEGDADDVSPSDFELELQSLFDGTENGKGLPYYWEWADWKQRTGNYGLLFLGFDDGKEMAQPVDQSNINAVEDLQYCNTFWQSDVVGWRVAGEYDASAPIRRGVVRPDQPLLYEIEFEHATASGEKRSTTNLVHHERLIHICEQPTSSEWVGKPCLETHINRLIDAEKTMGASAEAQYRNADRKFVGTAETDGMQGADEKMIQQFDEQMWELVNDMRTTAYGENMELDVIGGDDVDPSGPLEALWPFFAGASGMPQRVMTGSERGDLASTQDQSTWYSRVAERQQNFVTQSIIRPTIDRLLAFGALTPPVHEDDEYTVVFPDLFELTDLEKAEVEQTRSQTVKNAQDAIAAGADPAAVREYVGLPQPDESSGQQGSADDIDAVNAINPDDPDVRRATSLTADDETEPEGEVEEYTRPLGPTYD